MDITVESLMYMVECAKYYVIDGKSHQHLGTYTSREDICRIFGGCVVENARIQDNSLMIVL